MGSNAQLTRGAALFLTGVFLAICVKLLRNYCCSCHWLHYSRCLCDRDVLTAVTWWWQWKSRQGISLRDCVIYSRANCGFDKSQHGSHLPHSNAPPCVVWVTARVAGKGRRVCMRAKTGNDLDLFRENAPSVASARPVHWETRNPDAILFLVDTTLIWACTSWLA